MRKILLLTLGSLFACIIHAQIATDELPYGLLNNVTAVAKANRQNVITLPAPDIAAIVQEYTGKRHS